MSNIYNLFISHSWSYLDDYEKLINLLNQAKDFEYQTYSIPNNDPVHTSHSISALSIAIKEKMKFCTVLLLLVGKYSTFSNWIQKEVTCAKKEFGIPLLVIGIKPNDSTQVSPYVAKFADEIVSWNINSIVDAIRRYYIQHSWL